ncbi:MAG: hypothetical protein ABSC53_03190 [Bacteroidota bacterium]
MLQNEFDLNAKSLFDQLRVRVDALKASMYIQRFYEDITDAESDFDKDQKNASFIKYNDLL